MKLNKEMLGELLNAPLALIGIKDPEIVDTLNRILPYSVGFEIECAKKDEFNLADFTGIPDIVDVNIDSSEQRFRIPNGIKGIVCLSNITYQLGKNSLLNPDSGIHYHVDCTGIFREVVSILSENQNWILKELDTWEYPGTYNSRRVSTDTSHSWIRCQPSFNTLEFRIGEMTFDYKLLLKRIIHINSIVRRLKEKCPSYTPPTFEPIEGEKIINYIKSLSTGNSAIMALTEKMKKLNNDIVNLQEQLKPKEEEIVFRNRLHKLNPDE